MATANTTVALDPELKKKVIARAKKEQLSLSDVIRFLLKGYVRGTTPAQPILTENGFTLEEEAEIIQASKDAKKGINVSPIFDNIDDALDYLDNFSE